LRRLLDGDQIRFRQAQLVPNGFERPAQIFEVGLARLNLRSWRKRIALSHPEPSDPGGNEHSCVVFCTNHGAMSFMRYSAVQTAVMLAQYAGRFY
jgi:hypothetical protein